ncbi:hypothetical protein [Deinococcus hopiensis]|uniref:Uncharacterized protein n=1 Tax=Deinococcus hopiensis KR-140 TaxID=695939 RepID=A0A1W1V8R9_9DEIO|nr:hypothetical protein [Deinococcus hopiensis]SMB89404.1 hypothetical protein SAMN00790413_00395 [Deinococcus hopiensis KR-140]
MMIGLEVTRGRIEETSSEPITILQPIIPDGRSTVLEERPTPEQVVFAGKMPALEADAQGVPMCVLGGDEVVGCFRLDSTPSGTTDRVA